MLNNKVNQQRRNVLSTPTTKQMRSCDTPTSHNKSPKFLKLIESKFAKQNELMIANIQRCVKESVDEAIKSFADKINMVSDKVDVLSATVQNLETKQGELQELKNEITRIKQQLSHQENINVSTNLRICGIPHYQNENLYNLFDHLCAAINITSPKVKHIQRIKNNKNHTADGIILVKLFTSQERNVILKSIGEFKRVNKTQLSLRIFGFDSDIPIFVNEDLTSNNYKLLQGAIQLKRRKVVSAAFSLRGIVHVKLSAADTPIRIKSADDLNDLFRTSQQSTVLSNNQLSHNVIHGNGVANPEAI